MWKEQDTDEVAAAAAGRRTMRASSEQRGYEHKDCDEDSSWWLNGCGWQYMDFDGSIERIMMAFLLVIVVLAT